MVHKWITSDGIPRPRLSTTKGYRFKSDRIHVQKRSQFFSNIRRSISFSLIFFKPIKPVKIPRIKLTPDQRSENARLSAAKVYARKKSDPSFMASRRASNKEWAKAHPENKKEWNKANRQKIRAAVRRWGKTPRGKITNNLRRRIRDFIFRPDRVGSPAHLLGCDAVTFMEHLQKRFQPGMAWNNYGPKGWHIDHIKPCASFDLLDPEQQKICFHYTNLQPLWHHQNIAKGAKLDYKIPLGPCTFEEIMSIKYKP